MRRCPPTTRPARPPTPRSSPLVADVVRRPRVEPADSFVLHAPLELAARAALLPLVAPAARDEARQRLLDLATAYDAAADPLPPPPRRSFDSPAEAARRLQDAIAAGDLDDVDAVAAWIGRAVTPTQLRALLADDVAPSLAAAAHAPIFLYLLPRVSPRGELTPELLRPLARELARAPEWRLSWHEHAHARRARRDRDAGRRSGRDRVGAAARSPGQRLHPSDHVAGRADGDRAGPARPGRRRGSTATRRRE